MAIRPLLCVIAIVLSFCSLPVAARVPVDIRELAALQATMQQYVDRKSVDGAYLYFDTNAAQVRELYPVTGHPMVMKMDQHFVLCYDFLDAKGEKVEVDYYIARKTDGFVIFHEAIGARNVLVTMMNSGRVKPVN
jgi:hypothetical protein